MDALPLFDKAPSKYQWFEECTWWSITKVLGNGLEKLARWRVCLEV